MGGQLRTQHTGFHGNVSWGCHSVPHEDTVTLDPIAVFLSRSLTLTAYKREIIMTLGVYIDFVLSLFKSCLFIFTTTI